jgi:hypothetical protein
MQWTVQVLRAAPTLQLALRREPAVPMLCREPAVQMLRRELLSPPELSRRLHSALKM